MPYLLDGDNLVGTERGRRGGAGDRDALVAEVSDRLRRTRAKVVLFFDGTGKSVTLGGLSVRFAGGISADDAIVREISQARRPRETTVVTADRELARRARDAGAQTLPPPDFWQRFGKVAPATVGPEEKPVDVADWMAWFESERGKKVR